MEMKTLLEGAAGLEKKLKTLEKDVSNLETRKVNLGSDIKSLEAEKSRLNKLKNDLRNTLQAAVNEATRNEQARLIEIEEQKTSELASIKKEKGLLVEEKESYQRLADQANKAIKNNELAAKQLDRDKATLKSEKDKLVQVVDLIKDILK